jgi:hypothetical protein
MYNIIHYICIICILVHELGQAVPEPAFDSGVDVREEREGTCRCGARLRARIRFFYRYIRTDTDTDTDKDIDTDTFMHSICMCSLSLTHACATSLLTMLCS